MKLLRRNIFNHLKHCDITIAELYAGFLSLMWSVSLIVNHNWKPFSLIDAVLPQRGLGYMLLLLTVSYIFNTQRIPDERRVGFSLSLTFWWLFITCLAFRYDPTSQGAFIYGSVMMLFAFLNYRERKEEGMKTTAWGVMLSCFVLAAIFLVSFKSHVVAAIFR